MGVFLPPCHVLLRLHYRHTMFHPVVESTKGSTYPGDHHLFLRAKQEVCLKYCPVKNPGGPGVCSLLPQINGEMCLSTPSLPNIINHFRPVIIKCSKDPFKVFKCRHHLQRSTVGLEGHCSALLHLLIPHPIEFPICPLGAHHCGLMLPAPQPPGNKHIAFGAVQDGMVTLLQDH